MTDYNMDICEFLNNNGIDTNDIDDDRSYFDGYDDVLVITIRDRKYKFLQNYMNKCYSDFTLFSEDGEIRGYDEVVKYFKTKFNL